MTTLIVLLCVAQGMLVGALISYLNDGVPKWVYWALGLNAAGLCAALLAEDNVPLAMGFAAQIGAAFAFLSNPPGAAA